MVRPSDEPRRQVEGNPIRLDPRFGRSRPDPYREAAGSRPPHRVVGRLRSDLSRIQTEPIIEVNRENAVSRRIFQNMHIRNRSSNIEYNSMVYGGNIEQPQQPYNLRRTRNKPRRLGVTNAEHQRSRPDAQDAAIRQREELRLLLESYTEPEGPSESTENCIQQPQQGNSVISESQLQESQPGTSGASDYMKEESQPGISGTSEYMKEEPQPGTSCAFDNLNEKGSSSSICREGSSDAISVSRRQGYWRPDLDIDLSSSEDEIIENHADMFTRKNPRQLHSERDIVQDMKIYMRAQAEMRRTEARITRTRNLSEGSSDSNSDLDINPGHQVENITITDSRTKTCRNSRRRHSKRKVVQEVKADMRAQAETRCRETRFKGKRNFSDIESDVESSTLQKTTKNLANTNARINLRRRHLEKDIPQKVKVDMRRQTKMRQKEARFIRNKNMFSNSCNSDSGIESAVNIKADNHESGGNTEAKTNVNEKNTKDDHHHFKMNIETDQCVAAYIKETEPIKTEENFKVDDGGTGINNDVVQKSDVNIEVDSDKADNNIEVDNHIAQKNFENDDHKTKKNFENNIHKSKKNNEDHKAERYIADSHRKTDDNIEGCKHKTDENIKDGHHIIKENIEAHHYKTERNTVNCHKNLEKNNEDVRPKTEMKFTGGHHKAEENVIADQRISRENNRNGHIESDAKFEAFLYDTALDSRANLRNVSNPIFNSKVAFHNRIGPHENIHKTESSTTCSSHLKLEHGRIVNESIHRSSLTSMLNITKKSTFTCSSLRNVFSDPFEEKWKKPAYDDEEDKERQESLKKLRNILFELLFESQMSLPKGSTPVEQWWNKGRVEVFAKPVTKSNIKIDQINVSKENETKVPSTREDKVEKVNDICQSEKQDKPVQINNEAGQESKEDNV